MPRVKRGTIHLKKRRNLLKKTKGYQGGHSNLIRHASTAVKKAGQNASKHRRKKKCVARRLWQIRLNAAVRENHDLNYSRMIHLLKEKNIIIDRKVLSELAITTPAVFDKIIETIKK